MNFRLRSPLDAVRRPRRCVVPVLAVLVAGCSSDPRSHTAGGSGSEVATPYAVERAVEREGVAPLFRAGPVLLAGQPGEEALAALARDGVTTVIDLRRASEERGFDEPTVVRSLGMNYVALPFGGDQPLTDAVLDHARGALRAHADGDVVLHCASANRVGAVWLAARVLDQGVALETALDEAHAIGLASTEYEDAARAYVLGAGKQGLGRIKETLRNKLPTVDVVGVDAVAGELDRERAAPAPDDGQRVLLLDARAPAEFAVSHLPGAINAERIEDALRVLGEDRARPIVVYCSVGYRSGYLARDLGDAGFTNVRNLEGSIFEWANTGHPVYRGEDEVREVHPFDAKWGELLERDLWSGLDD